MDNKMQQLAQHGNGNHGYVDNITEARKVFVHEFGGTLFTMAKDVKIQVEFNPAVVGAYRLIGYENRMLAAEDFNDDQKDAGEIGSGHTVTALYEIIPAGKASSFIRSVDALKYQTHNTTTLTIPSDEMMTIKFRYKAPDGHTSKLIQHTLRDTDVFFDQASQNMVWSAAVASFGMMLRGSEFAGNATYNDVVTWAEQAQGTDEYGYRAEFIRLVEGMEAVARAGK